MTESFTESIWLSNGIAIRPAPKPKMDWPNEATERMRIARMYKEKPHACERDEQGLRGTQTEFIPECYKEKKEAQGEKINWFTHEGRKTLAFRNETDDEDTRHSRNGQNLNIETQRCFSFSMRGKPHHVGLSFSIFTMSWAGKGLAKKYPCANEHPILLRLSRCSLVSTPSATNFIPRLLPR